MPPAAKGAEPLSYVARRQGEILSFRTISYVARRQGEILSFRTISYVRGVGNPMLRILLEQSPDVNTATRLMAKNDHFPIRAFRT
jgi:hypothetical protein